MLVDAQNNSNTGELLLHIDSGIATVTLNRPEKYNALSQALLTALQNALESLANDDSVRVIIIAANGKAFCAGHDLKEMRSTEDSAFHQALFEQCSQVMLAIHRMPQPVIARVNGIATAAGCQLVAACDLAVASENSKFAVSGINVGLFCSTPAVALSRCIMPKRAMQMLLTGEFINAVTALECGLVNEVVADDELTSATLSMAKRIASKSSLAIKTGKEMFYKQMEMGLIDAYDYAIKTIVCNLDSDDAREGIDAFLEKRMPEWKGK